MNATQRQERDRKAQARWEAKRRAKSAALVRDPVEQARLREEGLRDGRNLALALPGAAGEPDRVWDRDDAYARGWRDGYVSAKMD